MWFKSMAIVSFVESFSPRRRISNITAAAIFSLFIVLTIVVSFRLYCSDEYYASSMESSEDNFNSTTSFSASHRKLLQQGEAVETNRIWGDRSCSSDIVITQGPTSPMPNGIPVYTVEISNACISRGCSVSAIHFHCGWFSSARLINPRFFKRLKYDDCLVNDGKPLFAGETIAFGYANTFPYQLSVASAKC